MEGETDEMTTRDHDFGMVESEEEAEVDMLSRGTGTKDWK
jgi:hypothetical protein